MPPLHHEVALNVKEPLRKRRRLVDDQSNMDINAVGSAHSNPSSSTSNDGEGVSIENENQLNTFIGDKRKLCAQKTNLISSAISDSPINPINEFEHENSKAKAEVIWSEMRITASRMSGFDHFKMTRSSQKSKYPQDSNSDLVDYQSQILHDLGLKSSGFVFPRIHADCTRRFRFRTILYRHLATHCKSKHCPVCERNFGHWNTLVDHVYQQHTGHEPYICPLVGCNYANCAKKRKL